MEVNWYEKQETWIKRKGNGTGKVSYGRLPIFHFLLLLFLHKAEYLHGIHFQTATTDRIVDTQVALFVGAQNKTAAELLIEVSGS